MGGLFSSPSKKKEDTDDESTSTPAPPPTPYTYMYPGSLFKFKNNIDGINKIDIRENGGKVINPKIFYKSDGNYSPEVLKAVDDKIEQQYQYNTRWRDSDGSSPWDNWVPGEPSIPPRGGGGKRRRKSRKTKKARKSRKN